jgi:ribosome-associated protein
MANPFVEKEVKKIIQDQNIEYPKNMALASAWVIANYKGMNIKIYDVQESSSLCDYNIIASAQNTTQAKTMIDEIQYNLKRNGCEMVSLEGVTDGDWILLDMGDIIIHVFQEYSRDIFDLDRLWSEFDQVVIPQDYYFENAEVPAVTEEDSTDNYF